MPVHLGLDDGINAGWVALYGSGHAIHYDYWGKRIRWFRFHACEHTYATVKEPPAGRPGIYTKRCTKCTYEYSYDTTG